MIDYQLLFEASPVAFLVLDNKFKIVAANEAYLLMTLTKRSEIIGQNVFEVFPDTPDSVNSEGISILAESLNAVLEYRKPHTMPVLKYSIPKPGTKEFELRYWCPINSPILDQDGNVCLIVNRVEDVTEYILAKNDNLEQAKLNKELLNRANQIEAEVYRNSKLLNDREREIHNILENAPIGMATVGLNEELLEVNKSFCELLGYSKQELIKLCHKDIIHPDDLNLEIINLQKLIEDSIKSFQIEIRYLRKDGDFVWAQLTTSILRNENHAPIHYIIQIEDITGKKESARALLQKAEALNRSNDALDEFAYIASHDLKEPLRGISNYSGYLMEDYANVLDEEGQSYLQTLQKLSNRLENLLNNLLKFSRISRIDLAFTLCDLDEIVDEKLLLDLFHNLHF